MLHRRHLLLSALAPAMPLRAAPGSMQLCMHQTTSAAAGYRKSLEGYARAGIKFVEVVFPHVEPFVKTDGMPAARKLLSDLGLTAVSCGGVRGLWEPGPNRSKAVEDMKRLGAIAAELGVSRMVCPSEGTWSTAATAPSLTLGELQLRHLKRLAQLIERIASRLFRNRSSILRCRSAGIAFSDSRKLRVGIRCFPRS
jgi:sugar phosphate isomerase/epimerase